MIIKNSQLNDNTVDAINKLIDAEINAKYAFKLVRIVKEISSILDDKKKMEQKILNKYAEKDEDGNLKPGVNESGEEVPNTIRLSDIDGYNNEMRELYDVENNIPHDKILFEDLGLKTVKVRDILALDFLFE